MKRRKTRVVLMALFLMVAICMGIVPTLSAAERYSIIDLGTLGGASSTAVAINRNEQVVGYSDTPSGEIHAFLWQRDLKQGLKNSRMIDLGTLGGSYGYPWAINGRGQIVGESTIPSGETRAFLWQPGLKPGKGNLINLGTLDGFVHSYAYAINENGQLVGYSETESYQGRAFLWQPGTNPGQGTMIDLGTLGGSYSYPWAINGRGQIVGESTTASGETRAFLWQPGMNPGEGTMNEPGNARWGRQLCLCHKQYRTDCGLQHD